MAINYYRECLDVLSKLHQEHPTFSLGRHLSTALEEYGDVWGISNKEMLYALQKYQTTIEQEDSPLSHEDYVDKIVKDGMDLDNLLKDEDGDE